MAVKIRKRILPSGDMHWQADIQLRLPDGSRHRVRVKAQGSTKAAARRWAEKHEAHLLRHGLRRKETASRTTVITTESLPTLAEFAPRFRESYVLANRLKPSSRACWDDTLNRILVPLLGNRPLNTIGAREFQRLKMLPYAPNTINTLLGRLGTILRVAKDWGFAVTVPRVKRVKVPARLPEFYDFDEFGRLRAAARSLSPTAHAIVLLGGEAGLRTGEIIALQWRDVDLTRRLITVAHNEYLGHLGDPKGGATRQVPATRRICAALPELNKLGERVLQRAGGRPLTASAVRHWVSKAQLRAELKPKGPHILRHTFCSHLAMRGAAPRAIQALAGHAKSSTTDVYMHLSPRSLHDAIELLDDGEDE